MEAKKPAHPTENVPAHAPSTSDFASASPAAKLPWVKPVAEEVSVDTTATGIVGVGPDFVFYS